MKKNTHINFDIVKKLLIHICEHRNKDFDASMYSEKEVLEAKSFMMDKWISNGYRASRGENPVWVELSHPTFEARSLENLIKEDDTWWEKIVEMLKTDMSLSDILEEFGISDD